MIKRVSIRNFKSLKGLDITCKKLNIFIGPPNTGKSNILESLGFLSYLGGYVIDPKRFVRFLQPIDLFYEQRIKEKIIIEIDEKKVLMEYRNGGLFVSISFSPKEKDRMLELRPPFNASQIPSDVNKIFEEIKFYRFEQRENFLSTMTDFFLPSSENLLIILEVNPKLRKIISDLLSDFNLMLILKELENKMTIGRKREEAIVSELPYTLLSDTLQRLIYYICAIETNENSILIFEEPESHAFPYYTKYLGEMIALSKKNQYFISTHNPYFLSSIIEKSEKNSIKIFVTYLEEGQTKIKEIENDGLDILFEYYDPMDIFFNIENILHR